MAAKLTRGAALKKLIDERPGVALAAAAFGAWSGHVLNEYYSSWKSSKSSVFGETLALDTMDPIQRCMDSIDKERELQWRNIEDLQNKITMLEKERSLVRGGGSKNKV